jgi:hypothetical protein
MFESWSLTVPRVAPAKRGRHDRGASRSKPELTTRTRGDKEGLARISPGTRYQDSA